MLTVQTKTLLGKLMAAENITVEHRQANTARFNLKTRTLTLPIWKFMDGNLYDLLLGHEVSHALHTPPDGWHDAIVSKDKKAKSFKHFLNVVEDARIERFIKDKYPGLRKPMMEGYRTLLAENFFGLAAVDNYNTLYLIDKINLATKLGSLVNIRFTQDEQPYYDAVMKADTWNQVVAIAEKLFEYSKKEQQEGEEKQNKEMSERMKELLEDSLEEEREYDDDYDDDDDSEDGEEFSFGEEGEEGEEGNEDGESGEDEKDGDEGDEDEDKEDKDVKSSDKNDEKADKKTVEQKKGKGGKEKNASEEQGDKKGDQYSKKENIEKGTGDFIPRARTDESFREAEDKLVDKVASDPVYVNIPTPDTKAIITPASVVNRGIEKSLMGDFEIRKWALDNYNEFKERNTDYINLLVKEFEMRKAATAYKRLKVAETGDIDINKISQYRLQDDIFRKMMRVQKGKSHGLVLVLDKSGSMSDHMKGAIEQIVVLAMFCRKVNIPFAAYSFTTCMSATQHDFPNRVPKTVFSTSMNDLAMNHELSFRELLNSGMTSSQFTQSVINQLAVANGLRGKLPNHQNVPAHEGLGSTPLHEALIVLRDVVRDFKHRNGLDVVNAIVVHDGQSDPSRSYYKTDLTDKFYNRYYRGVSTEQYNEYREPVVVTDKKENWSMRLNMNSRYPMTEVMMKWFQQTTGCGIYGFFIVDRTLRQVKGALHEMYCNKDGIRFSLNESDATQVKAFDELYKSFTNEKFLESHTPGYSRFYIIPGQEDLEATTDGVVAPENFKWTQNRLVTAYKKVAKKKNASRVLVNRFIGMIAANQ